MELSGCGEDKKFLLEQLRQREFQSARGTRILAGSMILLAVVLALSPLLLFEAAPGSPGDRERPVSESVPAPAAPLESEDKTAKSLRWIVI